MTMTMIFNQWLATSSVPGHWLSPSWMAVYGGTKDFDFDDDDDDLHHDDHDHDHDHDHDDDYDHDYDDHHHDSDDGFQSVVGGFPSWKGCCGQAAQRTKWAEQNKKEKNNNHDDDDHHGHDDDDEDGNVGTASGSLVSASRAD